MSLWGWPTAAVPCCWISLIKMGLGVPVFTWQQSLTEAAVLLSLSQAESELPASASCSQLKRGNAKSVPFLWWCNYRLLLRIWGRGVVRWSSKQKFKEGVCACILYVKQRWILGRSASGTQVLLCGWQLLVGFLFQENKGKWKCSALLLY